MVKNDSKSDYKSNNNTVNANNDQPVFFNHMKQSVEAVKYFMKVL